MKTRSEAGIALALAAALGLLGGSVAAATTTDGATAEAPALPDAPPPPENPDEFLVRDLGIRVTKPPSWVFVNIDESRVSRFDLIAKSSGIDAARAISVDSIVICQMNKRSVEKAPDRPNPAVSISLQNVADVPQVTDARELAKQGTTALGVVFHDIEWIDFLEPISVGGQPGFKNKFRAGIDPKIWDGKLIVEQHFVLQDRIAVCVTYQDGEDTWKDSEVDFRLIRDALVIPKAPSIPVR